MLRKDPYSSKTERQTSRGNKTTTKIITAHKHAKKICYENLAGENNSSFNNSHNVDVTAENGQMEKNK